MKSDTVVGYMFQADGFCPDCIILVLPTGEGEAFDGWALAEGAPAMSAEANLSEIADAFGIDRENEYTFDSDDFPKVTFADEAVEHNLHCSRCGVEFV